MYISNYVIHTLLIKAQSNLELFNKHYYVCKTILRDILYSRKNIWHILRNFMYIYKYEYISLVTYI